VACEYAVTEHNMCNTWRPIFCATVRISPGSTTRVAPKNRTWRHNSRQNLDSPQNHLPQGESVCFNTRIHRKHDHQVESLLDVSVHCDHRTFFLCEDTHVGPFEEPTTRGTGQTNDDGCRPAYNTDCRPSVWVCEGPHSSDLILSLNTNESPSPSLIFSLPSEDKGVQFLSHSSGPLLSEKYISFLL
jgi:hypothetical protein